MPDISAREDQEEFRDESASLWRIALSPTVWAFHFLLCYGGGAVWCAKFGSSQGVLFLRLSVLGLTVLALAIILWQARRSIQQWHPGTRGDTSLHQPESRHRFLGHAALLLSIISGIGVVYVALPALFIASCQ
ncbi:hypothetical protein [Paracoccus shanxieyensis]|uniref:Uncharacterized protein n=1 Tax=Paracoccus shanxieyensis TaxID=2675752 RepID=A0A6L6J0C4_9RHOB|nr:hypothetical protein [Paracoccus shanxieyensis]MTH64852.1 hypothetical protein [Paracoccus shanxieyensis]MTH87915.1 hypothetical protein [Paracoccus shanxieyensis]